MSASHHALRDFVDAINLGDEARLVAAFNTRGVVDDRGRIFQGVQTLRSWAASGAIAEASIETIGTSSGHDHALVDWSWHCGVSTAHYPAYVEFDGDGKILLVQMPPAR